MRESTPIKSRVLYGLAFVAFAAFAGRPVDGLFPVWLCGTALALVKPPDFGRALRWIAVVLYVPCVFQLAMIPWPSHIFKMNYLLGPLTAVFLWVMLSARGRAQEDAAAVRISHSLAASSYSLYLVHYPLLAILAAILTPDLKWALTPRHLAIAAGLCGLAIAYGYGVAACTEWHNAWVLRRVQAGLSAKPMASPAPLRN